MKSLEILQDCLDQLKFLRDEYSNDIPQHVIHSSDKETRFKVRKTWFAQLNWQFGELIDEGFVTDPILRKKIDVYHNWIGLDHFSNRLTTIRDIQIGNRLINSTFKYFSGC